MEIETILSLISKFIILFNSFFFEYYVSKDFIGFYRITVCLSVFIYLAYIYKDILIFSDPSGIYNIEEFQKYEKDKSFFNIYNFLNTKNSYKLILVLFYLFGFFSIIGFLTQISLIVFFILFYSLQRRIFPINSSGGDVVANVIFLCLIFMNSGAGYSLDNFLFKNSSQDMVDAWPLRIIQITISFGYFWAFIAKIQSDDWIRSLAIKNAVFFSPFGKKRINLLNNDFFARCSSFGVMSFQFLSPILFWINEFRLIAIIWGLLLQILMMFCLRLGYFGPIMVAGILSFLSYYF
jgi:hypothetical protein